MFILPQSNVNFGGDLILYIIYSIWPIMIYTVKFFVKIILKSFLILLPVTLNDSRFEFHQFIWMLKQDYTIRDSTPYLFLQCHCYFEGWLTQSNYVSDLKLGHSNFGDFMMMIVWICWWQNHCVGDYLCKESVNDISNRLPTSQLSSLHWSYKIELNNILLDLVKTSNGWFKWRIFGWWFGITERHYPQKHVCIFWIAITCSLCLDDQQIINV